MTHFTAWIVALTLTGSPVTTSLCATACGHQSAPRAHCHDSLTETAPTAVSGDATCGTETIDLPYVKEDVSAPQGAALPVAPPIVSVVASFTASACAVSVPATVGWLAPPLVLRI